MICPQVAPRYSLHEAKATNTRAAFRRDSLLINAIIGVRTQTHIFTFPSIPSSPSLLSPSLEGI